jgi:tripartite-type tricarboxylate transporter receptor subunit TctC
LSETLKQQFFVENRAGAGGVIGSQAVASSPPDGYNLVISGIASHVIAPSMNDKVGFDPIKDFTHIAYLGGPPIVLIVHPSLGVKTLKELTAKLKASNESAGYVSPGPGTLGNLVAEYWGQKEKLKLDHIPYKGAAQAVTDLIGGHVKMGSMTFTTAHPHIKAGTVIPLAVSSNKRMVDYPDIPTFKELGYPDMVATTWFSVSGPAKLPKAIVDKLNSEIIKALDAPSVSQKLAQEQMETEKMSPEQFAKFVESEIVKWGPVAKTISMPEGSGG